MENIISWFKQQGRENPEQEEIVEDIVEELSNGKFLGSIIERKIKEGFASIEKDYKKEFNQNVEEDED